MLLDQIQTDLTAAQKARDQMKVDCLRFLLGAIFNLQIEKYPPSKGGPPAGGMTDEDVVSVIKRQVKTHQESIEMFTKAGRAELVTREQSELAILQSYLPAQMNESEIRSKIEELRKSNPGADFGNLMKLAMGELSGKAEGAVVAKIVAELVKS